MSETQGSALRLFKLGMVDNLRARGDLAGVKVLYHVDSVGDLAREMIWFGGARTDAEIPILRAGTKKVDETVDVELVVQVLLEDGQTYEDAERRGIELLVEVQQELAETTRPISEIHWAELRSWTADPKVLYSNDDPPRVLGAACRLECVLRYMARLVEP